jgi:hypothetical protein
MCTHAHKTLRKFRGINDLVSPGSDEGITQVAGGSGNERIVDMDLNVENSLRGTFDEATRIVGGCNETIPGEESIIATRPYTTCVATTRDIANNTKNVAPPHVIMRSITKKERQPFAHLGVNDTTTFFGGSRFAMEVSGAHIHRRLNAFGHLETKLCG